MAKTDNNVFFNVTPPTESAQYPKPSSATDMPKACEEGTVQKTKMNNNVADRKQQSCWET